MMTHSLPGINFRFPDGSLKCGTLILHADGTRAGLVDERTYALDLEHAWLIRADKDGRPVSQVLPPEPEQEIDPRTLYPEVVLAGPLPAPYAPCTLRRFILRRRHDPTEVSGTGIVAEGVEYADNKMCALFWRNSASGGIYRDIEVIREKHCHHGFTDLVWIDGETQKTGTSR